MQSSRLTSPSDSVCGIAPLQMQMSWTQGAQHALGVVSRILMEQGVSDEQIQAALTQTKKKIEAQTWAESLYIEKPADNLNAAKALLQLPQVQETIQTLVDEAWMDDDVDTGHQLIGLVEDSGIEHDLVMPGKENQHVTSHRSTQ